jgi:multiple sugar transport system substrate-binding protein
MKSPDRVGPATVTSPAPENDWLDRPDPITRRALLKAMAGAAGAVALGSIAAACGGTAATPSAPASGAASAAAATPSPTKSGPVKLVLMTDPNEFKTEELNPFLAAHPNIKVEFIKNDLARFQAMVAAGNPPDVFRVQAAGIPQYIARKLLLDLQPYFEASKLLPPADLAPANDSYKWDGTKIGQGHLYGMVKDWSPDYTIFAYTKAFADAGVTVPGDGEPLTYQAVYELGKKVNKKNGNKRVYWGFAHSNAYDWIDRTAMNMLAEKDQSLYAADFTSINLTANPDAKSVFEFLFRLAKEGLDQNPADPSPAWVGADFTNGLVAMVQYGYWFSAMAESEKTKGKVVMLPAPTWAGVRRDPTMTATGWVISSHTKEPDAAWELFQWYMGDEPAKTRAASGWGVPGLISLYGQMPRVGPFQTQVQKVLEGELDHSRFVLQYNPYLSEQAAAAAYKKHIETALKGQIGFDEMLSRIESDVNQAIQDGKERIG